MWFCNDEAEPGEVEELGHTTAYVLLLDRQCSAAAMTASLHAVMKKPAEYITLAPSMMAAISGSLRWSTYRRPTTFRPARLPRQWQDLCHGAIVLLVTP